MTRLAVRSRSDFAAFETPLSPYYLVHNFFFSFIAGFSRNFLCVSGAMLVGVLGLVGGRDDYG